MTSQVNATVRVGSSRAACALLLVSAASSTGAIAAPASGPMPHRAIYDITLERAATASGIGELNGRMVYELSGSSCAGFTQKMRLVTRIVDREGNPQVNDLRTSSFETADGKRLDFDIRQFRDKDLAEATEGAARRTPDGASIEIDLKQPEKKTIAVDERVHFPMQHTLELLAHARAGDKVMKSLLYDGSERGERVFATTAFIGESLPKEAVDRALPSGLSGRAALLDVPAWPVGMSYYDNDADEQDAVPDYELSFRFHANGVSTDLVIDYGDFAIRGALRELAVMPAEPCPARQP
ncbi:MAG: cell envelope integrity EipB family protein [Hyphomicrobiaceae bacterium]|nr:cell envelope integrity EipB family protein [Hyphomicrobiaceae bacterium]